MRFVKTAESIFDIPSNFTRVEYLESTGTQYIDTGYIPKPTSTYKCGFELTNITTTSGAWFCVFGSVESNNVVFTELFLPRASGGGDVNQVLAGNHNSTLIRENYAWAINTPYDFEMTTTDVSINGVNQGSITVDSSVSCSHSIYLFARHERNDDVGYNVKAKIHSFKIYEDNTLVRDMIPCIDPLGRACLYDLVGKKAYYNQGTGEFTVGRQIIPVEYIEGTGTQYIDTGITGFADFELGIKIRENVSNVAVFCGNNYRMERINANNPYWRFRNNNDFYPTEVPITEYHVMKWKDDMIYCDGEKLGDFTKTWGVSANTTLFGYSGSMFPNMIYFCKLWNPTDGSLLRDYIPCKDENNNGFLFDKVSGVCYLNNGTGAFVVGQNKHKMKLRLIRDNILPTGYTQVEYLESTGTQYIDTGIIGDLTTELTCEAAIVEAGNASVTNIMGNNVTNTRAITINMSANITNPSVSRIRFGNTDNTTVAGAIDLNTFYKYDTNKNELTVRDSSGTVLNTYPFNATTAFTTNGNILIYKLGDTATQYIGKIKVKGATIKNTGVIVRNLIPAIDPSGTPCMYDLVSRTPFYNQGTGTFTTGKPVLPVVRFIKDILPAGYKAVNYLGSDSTAYIDTGVSGANNNLKIEMDFSYSKFYAYGYFFSNYESEQHDTTRFLLDASNNSRGLAYINTKSQNGAIYTPYNLTMNDKHNVVITKTTVSLDGVITTNPSPPAGTVNTKNIILFNRGAGSYADKRDVGMRCWSFKIWDNNTIVRNFIPVVRLLDNKAGMWDTVTKQFYTTPTGDFITG